MSVAVITGTSNLNPLEVDVAKVAVVELDPRTRHLLEAPIVPTLLRHAGRPELWQSPRASFMTLPPPRWQRSALSQPGDRHD
jgi:hypothetical protein